MSTLLRSGDIKNYTALGQDGQAVYSVAAQLRDGIKFKLGPLGQKAIEYLAIPQRNDTGSGIDWYVPFASSRPDGSYFIIPWTSATPEEREKALAELDQFKANILELGKRMAKSGNTLKGDQLLFSRLIYTQDGNENDQLKAIRFPSEEHIYLVDDRPVITFWGFTEKNSALHGDPFLSLRPAEPIKAVSAPPATPVEETQSKFRWWWLLLPLLLLLGLLYYFFLHPYFFPKAETTTPTTATTTENTTKTAVEPSATAKKEVDCPYFIINGKVVDKNGKAVLNPKKCEIIDEATKIPYRWNGHTWINSSTGSVVTDSSILQNFAENGPLVNSTESVKTDSTANHTTDATTSMQTDTQNQQDALSQLNQQNATQSQQGAGNDPQTNPNSQANPQGKSTELALDPQSLASGKTDFLNGNWNAGAGIQDKATGKPLKLSYNFNNGQGQATLQRGDGVSCSGPVSAAANGGGLNINNTGVANCSDGSTYQLPNVVCKPTTSGIADCSGSYNGGSAFPMSMKSN
ncbi:SrfA family protein [Glaesserella sp.]|uniref:SrfA family protein n=1 Tax=Glaesserella sp. TaxID=2094731 RepID=UPI00359FEF77